MGSPEVSEPQTISAPLHDQKALGHHNACYIRLDIIWNTDNEEWKQWKQRNTNLESSAVV